MLTLTQKMILDLKIDLFLFKIQILIVTSDFLHTLQ